MNSYAEPEFLRSVGLMITFWLLLKYHISTQNEGKGAGGMLGGILEACFLRAWACFPALKLLTS